MKRLFDVSLLTLLAVGAVLFLLGVNSIGDLLALFQGILPLG